MTSPSPPSCLYIFLFINRSLLFANHLNHTCKWDREILIVNARRDETRRRYDQLLNWMMPYSTKIVSSSSTNVICVLTNKWFCKQDKITCNCINRERERERWKHINDASSLKQWDENKSNSLGRASLFQLFSIESTEDWIMMKNPKIVNKTHIFKSLSAQVTSNVLINQFHPEKTSLEGEKVIQINL